MEGARIEQMFQLLNENMKTMTEEMKVLTSEIREMKGENERMRGQVKEQGERIEQLEREIRRKNIVVRGIADHGEETEEETRRKVGVIVRKLEVDMDDRIDIDKITRIGKYQEERRRPILLKLTRESKKGEIMRSSKRLKGTDVWLDEDYPRSIREERRVLIAKAKEAKQQGHRAYVGYNRLVVDGDPFTAEEARRDMWRGEKNNKEGQKSSGQKRSVLERSPDGDSLEEQIQRIHKTSRIKN